MFLFLPSSPEKKSEILNSKKLTNMCQWTYNLWKIILLFDITMGHFLMLTVTSIPKYIIPINIV